MKGTNRPWMWAPVAGGKIFKRCKVCGRNRRLKHFSKDKKRLDGRISICRECTAQIRRGRKMAAKASKEET